jgi:hypothetical protein
MERENQLQESLLPIVKYHKSGKIVDFDQSIPVLQGDSSKTIKEKVFIVDSVTVPNLTRVVIDADQQTYTLYSILDQEIQNGFEILENRIVLEELYIDLVESGYSDLKEIDLRFAIEYQLRELGIKNASSDFEDYINNVSGLLTRLSKIYSQTTTDPVYKDFLEALKHFDPRKIKKVRILEAEISLSPEQPVSLNLSVIFNGLELDQEIPFSVLGKKEAESAEPLIKVFNRGQSNPQRDITGQIKGWVLNEKKKQNIVAYKAIKGLVFKIWFQDILDYIGVIVSSDGTLKIIFKDKTSEPRFENPERLLSVLTELISDLINRLNVINGAFEGEYLKLSLGTPRLDSVTTQAHTAVYIEKNKVDQILRRKIFTETLARVKPIENEEVLSLISIPEHSTINLRDNPYDLDSSIIIVYNCDTYTRCRSLTEYVVTLGSLQLETEDDIFGEQASLTKRKLREKSNKKFLKEQGILFDSRECQGIRQPKIVDSTNPELSLLGESTIAFNGHRYHCPVSEYNYPGFTSNNIVCCFKNNQAGQETYIRNTDPEALSVYIQPSNFPVTIRIEGKTLSGMALRSVSEDPIKFYILANSEEKINLVTLETPEIVNRLLELPDNAWIEQVPLSTIVYPSSTNKCPRPPNLKMMGSEDPNQACIEHPDHPYFGYNGNGIPCCFERARKVSVANRNKGLSPSKQYIITSDRLLNNDKLGTLPESLRMVVESLLPNQNVYRLGVYQNDDSFLNTMDTATDNGENLTLKKRIREYLRTDPEKFLQYGELVAKYQSLQHFLEEFGSARFSNYSSDLRRLVSDFLKVNLCVLKTITGGDLKIFCPETQIAQATEDDWVILIEKDSRFEIVVLLNSETDKIFKTWKNDSPLVAFLKDFTKETCIQKSVVPETYDLVTAPASETIPDTTELGKVRYQIVSPFNKVTLLMTTLGFMIPVEETDVTDGLIRVSILKMFKTGNHSLFKNLDQVVTSLQVLNKRLGRSPESQLACLGIVESKSPRIQGVLTNTGIIIPIVGNIEQNSQFPLLKMNWYPLAEYHLKYDQKETAETETYQIRKRLYEIKIKLAEYFKKADNRIVVAIKKLVLQRGASRNYKYSKLFNLLNKMLGNQNQEFSAVIANELIDDNLKFSLLKGIVTSKLFDIHNIIRRDSETVLMNINEINKFTKNLQE